MPLILAADGRPPLYLSGWLLRHRRAYYDAFLDVQLRGNWTPWIKLMSHAVVDSCDNAIAIARDLTTLRDQWLTRLSDLRDDATARLLPTWLLDRVPPRGDSQSDRQRNGHLLSGCQSRSGTPDRARHLA